MQFLKSLQGSKRAITIRPVSIESTLLLFLLPINLLAQKMSKFFSETFTKQLFKALYKRSSNELI